MSLTGKLLELCWHFYWRNVFDLLRIFKTIKVLVELNKPNSCCGST